MSKKKKFTSKKVLKKDIVIKAGTVFDCIDGRKSDYISGNYSSTLGLTKDSCGEFIYGFDTGDKDINEWFEDVTATAE